jgi:hypothetical protein
VQFDAEAGAVDLLAEHEAQFKHDYFKSSNGLKVHLSFKADSHGQQTRSPAQDHQTWHIGSQEGRRSFQKCKSGIHFHCPNGPGRQDKSLGDIQPHRAIIQVHESIRQK